MPGHGSGEFVIAISPIIKTLSIEKIRKQTKILSLREQIAIVRRESGCEIITLVAETDIEISDIVVFHQI